MDTNFYLEYVEKAIRNNLDDFIIEEAYNDWNNGNLFSEGFIQTFGKIITNIFKSIFGKFHAIVMIITGIIAIIGSQVIVNRQSKNFNDSFNNFNSTYENFRKNYEKETKKRRVEGSLEVKTLNWLKQIFETSHEKLNKFLLICKNKEIEVEKNFSTFINRYLSMKNSSNSHYDKEKYEELTEKVIKENNSDGIKDEKEILISEFNNFYTSLESNIGRFTAEKNNYKVDAVKDIFREYFGEGNTGNDIIKNIKNNLDIVKYQYDNYQSFYNELKETFDDSKNTSNDPSKINFSLKKKLQYSKFTIFNEVLKYELECLTTITNICNKCSSLVGGKVE